MQRHRPDRLRNGCVSATPGGRIHSTVQDSRDPTSTARSTIHQISDLAFNVRERLADQ